jgi:cysteine desulfurase
MGLDHDRAISAVRLTLGRWSTDGDVDRAIDLLAASARRLHRGATHVP